MNNFVAKSAGELIKKAASNGADWDPVLGEIILASNGDAWVIAFYTGQDQDAFRATQHYVLQHSPLAGGKYTYIKKIGEPFCEKVFPITE